MGSRSELRNLWIVGEEVKTVLISTNQLWWDNLASFDAKHIDKRLGGVFAPYKKAIQVPVFSPSDLLDTREITQLTFYIWRQKKQILKF